MAVDLIYNDKVKAIETFSSGVDTDSSDIQIVHDSLSTTKYLTSASTPPTTKMAYFNKALSGGAATIDLTSLTGTNGASVTFNGLKVQLFKVKNPTGNALMTFSEAVSNGYELAGNAWKVGLLAGQEFTFYGNDATPDVGASAKDITLGGTGTETAEIIIVAG